MGCRRHISQDDYAVARVARAHIVEYFRVLLHVVIGADANRRDAFLWPHHVFK